MITPWEIYWILQLDSINNMLNSLLVLFLIACLGLWAAGILMSFSNPDAWDAEANKASSRRMLAMAPVFRKWALRLTLFVCVPLLLAQMFIPSTRTVAAMVIAPKLINSPTIQHEAGELYDLAKQALQNAVKPND